MFALAEGKILAGISRFEIDGNPKAIKVLLKSETERAVSEFNNFGQRGE